MLTPPDIGHSDLVKLWLKHNANVDFVDDRNAVPSLELVNLVSLLVEFRTDLNGRYGYYW